MILIGGANVYPAEIEAALDEHPAVQSSCVTGLPHEDLGNIPDAIAEPSEPVSDEHLMAHLRQRLAPHKLPRMIERATTPLRDDAGKVRRSAFRAERIARHPVGLEYTIVTVTCFFSQRGGASGGDLVFVRESAEDLFSADPVLGEVDLRWPGVSLSGCELAEGTVGPGCVAVQQVFGQCSRYSVSTRRRWCSLTISTCPARK